MKQIITLFLLVFTFSCSEKKIEEIQTNIVIDAMVSSPWKVTSFKKGGTDVTTDFSPYKFQFKENLKVDAIIISNNSVEKTGDWNADANARTITSTFVGANATLMLLNGIWKITNNSFTFVEASQTVNGEIYTLRLEKA